MSLAIKMHCWSWGSILCTSTKSSPEVLWISCHIFRVLRWILVQLNCTRHTWTCHILQNNNDIHRFFHILVTPQFHTCLHALWLLVMPLIMTLISTLLAWRQNCSSSPPSWLKCPMCLFPWSGLTSSHCLWWVVATWLRQAHCWGWSRKCLALMLWVRRGHQHCVESRHIQSEWHCNVDATSCWSCIATKSEGMTSH